MYYAPKKISYPRNKVIVRKNAAEDAALKKLRAFLDAAEPQLVFFLVTMWKAQGRAITYKELREAILAGGLSTEYLEQWQQDYSRFVVKHLKPEWELAMEAAVEEIQRKYPEWRFDPMGEGVQAWVESRGAAFVTNSTATQLQGLQAVIERAAVMETMTVDGLARAIRPMVGLTWQQSMATWNYFALLIEQGIAEKRAQDLTIRYAARQHRYRGYNIARTELAFAYNQGSYQGIKQAQEAGYMGRVAKIWCTADDERVCEYCGSLEGKTIEMDEDFDFKTKLATPANPTIRRTPPAHPSCRCTVMYEEIEPPVPKYKV